MNRHCHSLGVTHRLLTTENQVKSRGSPDGIFDRQSANGTNFSPVTRISPGMYHSTKVSCAIEFMTKALGSTEPVTEMSVGGISWGVGGE